MGKYKKSKSSQNNHGVFVCHPNCLNFSTATCLIQSPIYTSNSFGVSKTERRESALHFSAAFYLSLLYQCKYLTDNQNLVTFRFHFRFTDLKLPKSKLLLLLYRLYLFSFR